MNKQGFYYPSKEMQDISDSFCMGSEWYINMEIWNIYANHAPEQLPALPVGDSFPERQSR